MNVGRKAVHPVAGSADLCLIADDPLDDVIAELVAHLVP